MLLIKENGNDAIVPIAIAFKTRDGGLWEDQLNILAQQRAKGLKWCMNIE
jgi:hypothetical protein